MRRKKLGPRRRFFTNGNDITILARMLRQGDTYRRIARTFQCSTKTVQRTVNKYLNGGTDKTRHNKT